MREAVADAGRQAREVDQGELPGAGGRDHLHRPAFGLAEGGAQGLVAAHDLAERGRQHGRPGLSLDAQRQRHVIEGEPRLEAVDQPEPLLGEGGGGRRRGGGPGGDPLRRRGGLLLLALAELLEEERPLLAREPGQAVGDGGIAHPASPSSIAWISSGESPSISRRASFRSPSSVPMSSASTMRSARSPRSAASNTICSVT